MNFISLLSFVITGIVIVRAFRRENDFFSPGRLFAGIWFFALGLANLKLSRFQHEWSLYSWIVLLLGINSFLLGVFIIYNVSIGKKKYTLDEVRNILIAEKINSNRLYISIIILFFAYVVIYVLEWRLYGVLPIFATNPDRARMDIGVFGIHLFIGTIPIVLFLIFQFFVLTKKMTIKKLFLTIIFIVIIGSYFFLLNRMYYAMFAIMAIGFGYYSSRIITLRNMIIPMAIIFGLMIFAQSIRETNYVEHFLYVTSEMKYSQEYAILTGPYMYIAMNLENFALAVQKLEHFTFGYYTFDVVMALTGLKHWLESYFILNKSPFLVSGYNTFPFFWDYYYDFGIAGMTLLSFTIGFIIALLHSFLFRRPSIAVASYYSVAIIFVVLSFFTNFLSSLNFIFNIIVLLIVQRYIQIPHSPK